MDKDNKTDEPISTTSKPDEKNELLEIEKKLVIKNIKTKEEYTNTIYAFLRQYNPALCVPNLFGIGDNKKNHHYVGYIDDKLVFCHSAHCNEKRSTAYFGNYFMVPELRGKGLGSKLHEEQFNKITKEYSDFYMYAVAGMSDKYVDRLGVKSFVEARVMVATKTNSELKKVSQCIRDLKHIKSIENEYLEYNKKVFNYEKEEYDRLLLNLEDVDCVCSISEDNKLQGYGFIKRNFTGWLFGPVCADSQEIAEDIILALYNKVEVNEEIKIFIPIEIGKEDRDKVKYEKIKSLLGFEEVFKFILQGRNKPPNDFNYYYGISNLEHDY